MAAGIFSTTRVAGEGVALAVVSALLAALARISLRATVPDAPHAAIAEAAARLAGGNLADAAHVLPNVSNATLQAAYRSAFAHLLDGLTVITVVCSLAAFAFLSRVRVRDEALVVEMAEGIEA